MLFDSTKWEANFLSSMSPQKVEPSSARLKEILVISDSKRKGRKQVFLVAHASKGYLSFLILNFFLLFSLSILERKSESKILMHKTSG